MEIHLLVPQTRYRCLFKIDLIVWKLSPIKRTKRYIAKFKIDLIVWKFVAIIIDTYNNICLK